MQTGFIFLNPGLKYWTIGQSSNNPGANSSHFPVNPGLGFAFDFEIGIPGLTASKLGLLEL